MKAKVIKGNHRHSMPIKKKKAEQTAFSQSQQQKLLSQNGTNIISTVIWLPKLVD